MSRFHSYLNTAVKLIEQYKAEQPFAIFIKNYFSQHKKYGSKDRKQIAALCYTYFRLGFTMKNCAVEKKIITATFLCNNEPQVFLEKVDPSLNEKITLLLNDKLEIINEQFSITEIFPFYEHLSIGINAVAYCQSILTQPSLFLRLRPQCKLTTLKKLEKSKLDYQILNESCIELPPATNAETYFLLDKEVVIQDYNSQLVLNYLQLNKVTLFEEGTKQSFVSTWDCCAASGGKSILLYDILKGKIDLTVSDIRLSILLNLHQRFKLANLKEYNYFVEDLGNILVESAAKNYQLIICDAPCTGSGTWGRTPEQLCFFKVKTIKEFNLKQKRIVSKVIPHLMDKGIFVYITCSVFKEENEVMAKFIQTNFGLKMLYQEILTGYDKKADTMFVAIFKKEIASSL